MEQNSDRPWTGLIKVYSSGGATYIIRPRLERHPIVTTLSVRLSVHPQIHFKIRLTVSVRIDEKYSNSAITLHSEETRIDFEVKRSKFMVPGEDSLRLPKIHFWMITSIWIDPVYLNFTYISLVTKGKPLLILGPKGQRSSSQIRVVYKC